MHFMSLQSLTRYFLPQHLLPVETLLLHLHRHLLPLELLAARLPIPFSNTILEGHDVIDIATQSLKYNGAFFLSFPEHFEFNARLGDSTLSNSTGSLVARAICFLCCTSVLLSRRWNCQQPQTLLMGVPSAQCIYLGV